MASGGAFVDEATGANVNASSDQLERLLPEYAPVHSYGDMVITPVSHLASVLAARYVREERQTPVSASDESWQHLNELFGLVDWRQTRPFDLTVEAAEGNGQLDAAAKAGLLLAGLSEVARFIAERAEQTPGGAVNPLALTTLLADDLRNDGYFDGIGLRSQQLVLPAEGRVSATGPSATYLDGQTLRSALAQGIFRFLSSSRNRSLLRFSDAQALLDGVSQDANPRIFRSGGSRFDNTPPAITPASPPARWTREQAASFAVKAWDADGAGVHRVFARSGSYPVAEGHLEGEAWVFRDVQLAMGPNTVVVWAVDSAAPPNAGEGRGSPYELSFTVTRDAVPPQPSFQPSATGYFDERAVLLASAAVPARYAWPSGTRKLLLDHNSAIYKTFTRLSSGNVPVSGETLEAATPENDRGNVPFLQWGVAYNALMDAPIAAATYSIAVACDGCSAPPATGKLVAAARAPAGDVSFYDLPLSAETVPGLRQLVTGSLRLTITVSVRDEAGNIGTSAPVVLTWNNIAPPIQLGEDTSYADAYDVRSIYPYGVGSGTYHQAWEASAAITADSNGSTRGLRVVRYVARNPHPVPLFVQSSINLGDWSLSEHWGQDVHRVREVIGGWNCSPLAKRYLTTSQLNGTNFNCVPSPEPVPAAPRSLQLKTGKVSVVAYRNPVAGGGERELAGSVPGVGGGSYAVVPAASATQPGELVLYIVRPLETDRSFGVGPVRIPFPTLSWVGDGAYELPVGQGYRMFANDFLHWKWPHWFESAWDRYRVTAYLQLAQEDIVGDIAWSAGGVTAEGVALTGFGLRSLGGGSFTRTVRH